MKSGGVFFFVATNQPTPPQKKNKRYHGGEPSLGDSYGCHPGISYHLASPQLTADFGPRRNFAVLVVLADLPKMDLSHMMTARLVEGKFHDGCLRSRSFMFFSPEIIYRVFF